MDNTLKVDMWQVGKVVGPKPNLPDCLVRPWSYLVYAINSVEFDLEYVISSVAVWIHPGLGTGPPPFTRVLPPWFRSFWFQQNMTFHNYMFVPKRGGTLAIFMYYYWMNSENIHVLWVNLCAFLHKYS